MRGLKDVPHSTISTPELILFNNLFILFLCHSLPSPSPQRLMLIQTYWCYHLLIFSLLYVANMIPSQHYIPSPASPANEGIYHEEHVSKLSHRCLPGISWVINSSLQDVTEDQDWWQGNHVLLQALPFYKLTRWCHFSAQFSSSIK